MMGNTGGIGGMSAGAGLIAQKTLCEIVSISGYPTGDVTKGTSIKLDVKVKNNRNFPYMGIIQVYDTHGEQTKVVGTARSLIGGMLGLLSAKEVEIEIAIDTSDFDAGSHKLTVELRGSLIGIRGISQDSSEGASFNIV
jgi:hypothetical protein